jgi:hypothetical protein
MHSGEVLSRDALQRISLQGALWRKLLQRYTPEIHSREVLSGDALQSKYLQTCGCSETLSDTLCIPNHIALECNSRAIITRDMDIPRPPTTLKYLFLKNVSPEKISPDMWVLQGSLGHPCSYSFILLQSAFLEQISPYFETPLNTQTCIPQESISRANISGHMGTPRLSETPPCIPIHITLNLKCISKANISGHVFKTLWDTL